jgi:signal transduction histidine kinase
MWKTIRVYKTVFTAEFNNKKKDGSLYIGSVYISPILDENKHVKFYVSIERDITKAKEIEKAKTEFVSLASHQLRTPLSAINWYTELVLSGDAGKVTKEQKEYLQEVATSSKRMADLVNALLNVSRIEMGTFVIEPQKTDIISIIKDVIKENIKLVSENKVKIIEKYPAKKMVLNIDPNLTRIILQNLISNGIKYNKTSGSLIIELARQQKYITLKITDTGYGIPVKEQDKIFTKLFRAENIKQKVTEGTGLGLYIAKSILTQSGGNIWFKSAENKGTTFYVVIPTVGMKKKEGTKALT